MNTSSVVEKDTSGFILFGLYFGNCRVSFALFCFAEASSFGVLGVLLVPPLLEGLLEGRRICSLDWGRLEGLFFFASELMFYCFKSRPPADFFLPLIKIFNGKLDLIIKRD